MAERPLWVRAEKDGSFSVLVRAQPGARKSEVAGEAEGRLRIRLAAPAVENKANRELERFIASCLGLRPARVTVASGETGRQKRVHIVCDAEPQWERLSRE